MSEPPTPSAAPLPSQNSSIESTIASITILMYDWAPGRSEIRLKLPAQAEPGQPNAIAEQNRFRARVIADLDDARFKLVGSTGLPNSTSLVSNRPMVGS
jgi:hypothetical protein